MLKLSHGSACFLLAVTATINCAQTPGAEVYKTNCLPCHGVAGDADTPAGRNFKAPSFSSPDVLKRSDEQLFALAKKGKGQMPAWEDILTDEELRAAIAHIHTLQKR
jgi:mono/diheme cytochrome c family protein